MKRYPTTLVMRKHTARPTNPAPPHDQIAKLDAELRKYKEQLKKAKGPTAANIKRRAMDTLKRKKMYEQQRDQMAGQAFNIEQTSFAIDSIKDTQTTVEAMKAASTTLKMESKKLNMDQIEDTQAWPCRYQ